MEPPFTHQRSLLYPPMADTAGKGQLGPDQNPTRTRKLFSSFIFKTVMAVLFLVLVPVLTSHPPEFIVGQSAHARSWEILHILLVGIAVSYGLFSKRNAAAEAEDKEREKNGNAGKFENAQSYVNRFLQLSSLFDDESDGGGGSSPCGSDVGRIQSMAWNSQYFRNEPMLIVDEDRNVGDSSAARISDKPLLLPVRSLRSRVPDDPRDDSVVSGVSPSSLSRSGSTRSTSHDSGESGVLAASFRRSSSNPGSISRRFPNGGSNTWSDLGESGVSTGSFSRSGANPGSNSKRVPIGGSTRSRNGRVSDAGYPESEANVKDSVVLPSPIPWQSRSGRMMDAREGVDLVDTFEIDDLGESWPQVSWSSSSALSTPLPNRLSLSSSLSLVSPEAKIVTDCVKKKSSSNKARIPVPPPPPPPPPPATTFRFPVEKTQSVPPPVNNGNNSSVYRDVDGNHPRSVRTIRASAETVRKNALEQNFFDGVLENEERRQEFFKRMIIESDNEETDNDDSDDNGIADEEDPGVPKDRGALPSNEVVEVVSHGASEGGPDVDKKADEFIAKFREQIRLQRIESMKRSSAEISKNPAR